MPDDSVRFNELRSGNADIAQLIRGRDVPAIKADANLNYYEDHGRAGSTASSSTPRSRPSRTTSSCARPSSTPSTAMPWPRRVGGGVGAAELLRPDRPAPSATTVGAALHLRPGQGEGADQGVWRHHAARCPPHRHHPRGRHRSRPRSSSDARARSASRSKLEGLERVAWGQKVRQNNDFEMATQQTEHPARSRHHLRWAGRRTARPPTPARTSRPIQDCLKEGRSTYDRRRSARPIYVKCHDR